MTPFHSTASMIIYTIIVVLFIFGFSLRVSPLRVAYSFVWHLVNSRVYALLLAAVLFILFINKLELMLEEKLDIRYDFTQAIYNLEGETVRFFQSAFEHYGVTLFVAFFYVIVFPALLIASIGIYTFTQQYKLYYTLLIAIFVNYVVAIPFYLFFPVFEVWSFAPSGVRFLMLDVYPDFEETYRNMSGLNNCFPSLHTSLSVTIALTAWKSKQHLWKWFAAFSAVVVIFSIFYLGIHWITDMFAGVLLGWIAVKSGSYLSERYQLAERTLAVQSAKQAQ